MVSTRQSCKFTLSTSGGVTKIMSLYLDAQTCSSKTANLNGIENSYFSREGSLVCRIFLLASVKSLQGALECNGDVQCY